MLGALEVLKHTEPRLLAIRVILRISVAVYRESLICKVAALISYVPALVLCRIKDFGILTDVGRCELTAFFKCAAKLFLWLLAALYKINDSSEDGENEYRHHPRELDDGVDGSADDPKCRQEADE